MKRLLTVVLCCFVAGAGCAPAPTLTLDQIQTHRVIAADKASLMDAARMFTIQEQFKISSFEAETGRVIAYRNTALSRQNETRLIILHLSIVQLSATESEVDARFAFSDSPGALTREQENVLVDCYTALFQRLGLRP
jgi:hypothetical protein